MANKSFKQLFREARQRDGYWAEKVKLQFADELFELMERRGVNKTDLAGRIGSSAAYITKALRGDTNFTIDSMIKLVRAVEGKVSIHVMAQEDREMHFRCIGRQTHQFETPAAGSSFNRIMNRATESDTTLEVA